MTNYLGNRVVTAKPAPANPVLAGGWAAVFDATVLNIKVLTEVYRIVIKGPTGSQFQVFVDDYLYDNVSRGDINSWDPVQPMVLTPGQQVTFYWNTATGSAPLARMWLREPAN